MTSHLGSLGCVVACPVWAASEQWVRVGQEQQSAAHSQRIPWGTSQRHCHHLLEAQTNVLQSRRHCPSSQVCRQGGGGGPTGPPLEAEARQMVNVIALSTSQDAEAGLTWVQGHTRRCKVGVRVLRSGVVLTGRPSASWPVTGAVSTGMGS